MRKLCKHKLEYFELYNIVYCKACNKVWKDNELSEEDKLLYKQEELYLNKLRDIYK